MIAFEADVVEAAGDGRLRVRLANGHALEALARNRRPVRPGQHGLVTLAPSPTARWRFRAGSEPATERP